MPRVVYGVRPVLEVLRARGREVSLVVLAESATAPGREIAAAARTAGVAITIRPRVALNALTHGGAHQGAAVVLGEYPYAALDDLLAVASQRSEPPLLALLDGVQDPQNLGAIVRSAHVFGAHGVIIPCDRAAPVTAGAVKASAGATEHTRIARITNVARTIGELRERGIWSVAGVAEGGQQPWEVDLTGPVVIVVGGEEKGVRPLVLRECDFQVTVPMVGQVASLNASAAAAVLLYEALRQRRRAAGEEAEA
jgi:23S rRNA (guanosine2251-2'-O)-methyltransferase